MDIRTFVGRSFGHSQHTFHMSQRETSELIFCGPRRTTFKMITMILVIEKMRT
jgi:hypothetical protein